MAQSFIDDASTVPGPVTDRFYGPERLTRLSVLFVPPIRKELAMYSAAGQTGATLVAEDLGSGHHLAQWTVAQETAARSPAEFTACGQHQDLRRRRASWFRFGRLEAKTRKDAQLLHGCGPSALARPHPSAAIPGLRCPPPSTPALHHHRLIVARYRASA